MIEEIRAALGRDDRDRPTRHHSRPVNRARGVVILAGWLALLAVPAWSQPAVESGRRTMEASPLRDGERITLDGRLDEPGWGRAVPATDFIQQDPINGGVPTEPTEVRIVYDAERLYMGVTCFDSEPDKLLGNTMKRDEFLRADDRFMWVIDTFLDERSGYFFEMNPSGLMADSLMGPTGPVSREWDGIWNAQVRRSDIGWTIEIEIPFRTLNFDPSQTTWGINFQRTIRRRDEEHVWTGHAYNQGLFRLANAGLVTGLGNMTQGLGLDVVPYGVAKVESFPGRNAPAAVGDATGGLDLFYSLTPSLRSNFTFNTDFAETEVDQRLVNLTRFPLFFPEKRDFFLEGASFLDFGSEVRRPGAFLRQPDRVIPFFSRRIGLDDESGVPQKIDFGTKLTGQVGAQDIGVLHVRTGTENDTIGEDFTVLRVKRNVLGQSYVGGMYTRRATRGGIGPDLHTAGLDFRLATSTFRGSDNLEVSGFYVHTTNPEGGGESAAFGASIDYPNDRWDASLGFRELQGHYDPAIGFTPRNGFRRYNPTLMFAPRPREHPWIRQFTFGISTDLRTDTDNVWLTRQIDMTAFKLSSHSGDSVEVHVVPSFERLEEDFEISDGIVLDRGREFSFWRYGVQLQTGNRRVVAAQSKVEVGSFFSGDREEVTLGLAVRPRVGVVVNMEGEWNRVSLVEGTFETRLYRVLADTQFSPWVQLGNTMQYDSVSRVLGWQSRFRWILTPGNDLFVVYLHNWREDPLQMQSRFETLDRRAATKFVFTQRF